MNFGQYVTKNEDNFIYYTIDEKNIKYNVKLGFGYYINDNKTVGVGFRFINDENDITYENAVRDTINTSSHEKSYVTSVYYGISKPLFGSKRVFFISDPSLFFTTGSTEVERNLDELTEFSKSHLKSISIGLHVGIQAFIAPKLSAQFAVGPVGVGYQWEEFTLDDEPNGTAESFFIRMSPDIFNFEFSISRYF